MTFFRRKLILLALVTAALPAVADPSKPAYLHYLQGMLLEQQGNYDEAMKEYDSVVALDPKAAYVQYQRAELALELGRLDDALASAERAIELDGPTPRGLRLLGNVHWARGDSEAARAAFEDALELDPQFSEAILALANLTAATEPDVAKGYWERLMAADPDRAPEALYQIALLEERRGDLDAAAAYLKDAVTREPDFLQARYSLAQLYEVRKDTAAALVEYMAVADREPGNAGLWVRVGELKEQGGDEAGAVDAYRKAIAADATHPGASFHLAARAEEAKEWEEAAALLRKSAMFDSDARLQLRYSYYLTQQGKLVEAVQTLEAARAKWPKDAEVAYFLALGYDGMGRSADALPLLQQAAEGESDNRDVRFQLAATYEKLGRVDESAKEFRALLEVFPEDAASLNYLGYSLADRGRELDEALYLISKAVALEPDNGAYIDSLGWAHFKLGRSTEALQEIRLALRQMPEDEAVWEHLGDIQSALGDKWAAWEAWKTSLAIKPGNRTLAAKVQELESKLDPDQVGARTLKLLGRSHGAVKTLLGSFTASGKVAGKPFGMSGLIHFERAGDGGRVRLQILGPLFIPLWRGMLDVDGTFDMDPLALEGVKEDDFRAAAAHALAFLRDTWTGKLFDGTGMLRRGWSKTWIETKRGRFFLSPNGVYVQSVETKDPGWTVKLKGYDTIGANVLPKVYEFAVTGFSSRIEVRPTSVFFVEQVVP